MKKFNKKTFFIILTVVVIVLVLAVFGVYKCPFRYFFGVPCPTCGITRAIVSVFSLHFAASFYYYALWPLFIIALIFYALFEFNVIKISKKTFNILVIIFAIIILVYYILRHIYGSPIVQIDFHDSLLYKIITSIEH